MSEQHEALVAELAHILHEAHIRGDYEDYARHLVESGWRKGEPENPHEQSYPRFEEELRILLNRRCAEASSNTPDFVLASYLFNCLEAFNDGVRMRDEFYGFEPPWKREEFPHGVAPA